MKKAIWVLENIKQSKDFYDELTILMLVASICSWKEHNQTFNEFHCDSMTFKKLESLNLLHLWDSVITQIVDRETSIDKVSFWASSKIRVLSQQTECVSLVDTDFISYSNISEIGKEFPVVYSHDEDATVWYQDGFDQYIRKIKGVPSWLIHTPCNTALNVCYLSFNDYNLQKEYADYSLNAMEELTRLEAPSAQYMTFAEQKILKLLLTYRQVEYKTLISNIFDCKSEKFHTKTFNHIGEWRFSTSKRKFYHIGFDKKRLRKKGANLKFLYIICNNSNVNLK